MARACGEARVGGTADDPRLGDGAAGRVIRVVGDNGDGAAWPVPEILPGRGRAADRAGVAGGALADMS